MIRPPRHLPNLGKNHHFLPNLGKSGFSLLPMLGKNRANLPDLGKSPKSPIPSLFNGRTFALWLCGGLLLVFFCCAIAAGAMQAWYHIHDEVPPWQEQHLDARYEPPSRTHWLGTDGLGRSVALRLMQGAWIAFQVGVVSSLIAIPLGVLLGCIGGYFGGRLDDVIVWLCTTFSAIPGLLFVLAIAMVVGKGLLGVFLAIGLTTWVGICRLVRAEVMRQKARGYVMAARALGFPSVRILFRHILPNVLHIAIITFTLRFPASISTEIFLSFLGIGVQDQPSWGVMLSSARLRLWQGMWWELAAVTIAIFLVVLSFHILGDTLRDALDPRLKQGNT